MNKIQRKDEYQIEADVFLLAFETYDDYLNSFIRPDDLANLRNTITARKITELGYRSTGETLNAELFYKRRAICLEAVYPTWKPYILCSERLVLTEPLLLELQLRERANRVGKIASIIFIECRTKTVNEISGFIDYEQRLKSEDWHPIFLEKKKIWPRPTDLGYYNWKTGDNSSNSTFNFKAIVDPERGLLFQNRFDRKIICVDPKAKEVGLNSTRLRIYSKNYKNVVIYDHIIRTRS